MKVSTFDFLRDLGSQYSDSQNTMNTLLQQMSTGQVNHFTDFIDGQNVRVSTRNNVEYRSSDLQISLVSTKMNEIKSTQDDISALINVANSLKTKLISNNSTISYNHSVLKAEIDAQKQSTERIFNSEFLGMHKYGGTMNNSKPFSGFSLPNFAIKTDPSTWSINSVDSSYYNGDNQFNYLNISGNKLGHGMSLADDGVKYLIGGIHLSDEMSKSTSLNSSHMQRAQELINKSIQMLTDAQLRVAEKYTAAKSTEDRLRTLKLSTSARLESVKSVERQDPIELGLRVESAKSLNSLIISATRYISHNLKALIDSIKY